MGGAFALTEGSPQPAILACAKLAGSIQSCQFTDILVQPLNGLPHIAVDSSEIFGVGPSSQFSTDHQSRRDLLFVYTVLLSRSLTEAQPRNSRRSY